MAHMNEESESTLNDELTNEPRVTGHVKWFDPQKGYGFIKRDNGSDVFVHFSNINREPQTLHEFDRVEFTLVPGEKGPEARNVNVRTEAA